MPRHLSLLLVAGFSCAAALFVACVGDAPSTSSPDGDGGSTDATTGTDVDIGTDGDAGDSGTLPHIVQISAGYSAACALLSDSTVWCWGDNAYGRVGAPITVATQPTPIQLPVLTDVVQISVGDTSACALERDGSVWCWGRNTNYELGGPSPGDLDCGSGARCNPVPTKVAGVTAVQIAAGQAMACAIAPTNGQVSCWGTNSTGECSIPPDGGALGCLPTPIPKVTKAKRIQLGYNNYTACAIDGTNQVWCWGLNDRGQLGHAPGTAGDKTVSAGAYDDAPHLITMNGDAGAPFDQVVDLLAASTICAVRSDGSVWCWGRNDGDELNLGHADTSAHPIPTQIVGVSGATSVTGGEAVCSLVAGGATWCWGGDQVAEGNGQLIPDGGCQTFAGTATPCYGAGQVPAPPFASLSAFGQVALGVTFDGGAYGWGHNNSGSVIGHPLGTQGDDGSNYNIVPTPVVGLP